LFLTSARYRRRWGGGESEASIPSRFLSEVPEALVQDLSPRKRTGQVDLYGERQEVREAARRNLYTGKTYNSVENIQQFFNERGKQPVAGPAAPATVAKTTPAGAKTAPAAMKAAPAAMKAAPAAAKAIPTTNAPQPTTRAKPLRNGSSIIHPKYGRGTVLRREGDGDDAKLTVSFPGYGLKKLIEKYAGIKEE
jgi:DNA helicase-2/ATP-dependent DNA helicase PcrA